MKSVAEANSKRSESIKNELASGNSPADCRTLYTFAMDAQGRGKLKEAKSLYKRSVETCEQSLGAENVDLARPLSALATLYRDNHEFDIKLADPLFRRALDIREKALGPDSPFTAETLSDRALLYFFEKDPIAGEHSAERALAIQQKQLGSENLDVALTLNRLGLCQRDLRKFPESEANLKRALAIRESPPRGQPRNRDKPREPCFCLPGSGPTNKGGTARRASARHRVASTAPVKTAFQPFRL